MSLVVERMLKVAPRLVDPRAAPAAKACNKVAPASLDSTKDSPIGAPIPVRATEIERERSALKRENEVERPPKNRSYKKSCVIESLFQLTLIH